MLTLNTRDIQTLPRSILIYIVDELGVMDGNLWFYSYLAICDPNISRRRWRDDTARDEAFCDVTATHEIRKLTF